MMMAGQDSLIVKAKSENLSDIGNGCVGSGV